uniref:Uncharacterized protein n=1 Tax=Caenorhabditis japonica TaxID=281687 RepID=A0A8R1IM26_CAEJA
MTVSAPSAPIWISKYLSSKQIAHFAQHKAVRSLQAGDTSLTWEIPDDSLIAIFVFYRETVDYTAHLAQLSISPHGRIVERTKNRLRPDPTSRGFFIDMVRSCSPPHSPSLPLVMLSRVTQRSHTMAPHSGILRPLSKAHNHCARLDTLRSPCTLAHGPDYAQQPAARTIDDRRRPSDVRRLLDTHTLPPTNQDRAADQSALMETFWKDPAHFWHYIRRRFRPFRQWSPTRDLALIAFYPLSFTLSPLRTCTC